MGSQLRDFSLCFYKYSGFVALLFKYSFFPQMSCQRYCSQKYGLLILRYMVNVTVGLYSVLPRGEKPKPSRCWRALWLVKGFNSSSRSFLSCSGTVRSETQCKSSHWNVDINLDLCLLLNIQQFHSNNRSKAVKKDGTNYSDYF